MTRGPSSSSCEAPPSDSSKNSSRGSASFDLPALFSVEVGASWGEVTPDTISTLSALDPEEVPPGYSKWVGKRQREYRAGRHHARTALRQLGVVAPKVLRGDDGLPLFPEGWSGTISHTGRQQTLAAAVVCSSPHRVGLDVEERKALSDAMIRIVLSPQEREVWARQKLQAERGESETAVLAFSMKEAFYKTVYPATGVYLGFHEVTVRLGEEAGTFTACILEPHAEYEAEGGPASLAGRFQMSERYVACGVTWSR